MPFLDDSPLIHLVSYLQGFVVAGFPCNQFGAQEPGSNSEIKSFAKTKYGVTFPLFSKVNVNGPNADPIFDYLKNASGGNCIGPGSHCTGHLRACKGVIPSMRGDICIACIMGPRNGMIPLPECFLGKIL